MPSSASTAATRRWTAPAPWACSRPSHEGLKAESPNVSQRLHAPGLSLTHSDRSHRSTAPRSTPSDGDRLRRTGRSPAAAANARAGRQQPQLPRAPHGRGPVTGLEVAGVAQARGFSTLSGTDSALITPSDVGSAGVVAFMAQSARTRIRLPDMKYR